MAKPQIRFEVDWDHDLLYANANSDITGDVSAQKDWVWSSGRAGNSVLATRSKAGKLVLPLFNDDGLYSSFLSSGALFGLIKPGRRVRVHLGSRAAQLDKANSEHLSIADNASLSTGNIDVSGAQWLWLDSKASDMSGMGKYDAASNQREYLLKYSTSADRFQAVKSHNGTNILLITANNFGAVSTGVWIFVVWWHDAAADTFNLQINDGTVNSASNSLGMFDSSSAFSLGSSHGGASVDPWDGRMGPAVFSKEVWTAAERTWLYNGGNARHYSDLGRAGPGSALLTNLEAWWELDEASGIRVDSHGSNDLTDNNTVLDAPGLTNYLSWSGRLDTIVPAAAIGRIQSATLTAFGNLTTWQGGKPRTTRQTNIRTDAAQDKLADDIGWPAASTGARAFEVGQETMPFWSFPSGPMAKTNALQQAQDVEDTEMGWFRESERDDVVFEDRHFRLTGARLVSQRSYSDDPADTGAITYKAIPQQDPLKDVFNRITAQVPSQSLASLTTLWTLGQTGSNSPLIGPGETQRFLAEYPTPNAINGDIGAVWTTPDVNDISANSESGGGGSDLFSDLTIAVIKGLDVMVIALTNGNATTGAFITALKARGQAVQEGDQQSIEEFDQASIDDFGDREFQLRAKFLGSMQEAVDQARYAIALNKDLVPKMKLVIPASKDLAHAKEAGIRRLSDRITVESDGSTKLGIKDLDMFVEAIEHRISGGGSHTMTLTVSEASASGGKVIVLDTGPGLDTGILGFA